MTIITPTQLREHVETDLADTALQRLLDDGEAEIVQRFGANAASGTVVEYFTPTAGSVYLFPSRAIGSVTSVVESFPGFNGETTRTLVAGDDYVVEGEWQIRRKHGGEYPASAWAGRVTLTYTPSADVARRSRVLIDLVRLALRYDATGSVKVGDVSIQHVDYERERDRILARLGSMQGSFV